MSAPREDVERFVAAARAACPGQSFAKWKLRGFGNSKAMSDTLIDLVASGQKTGTFALASEFEGNPSAAPTVGDVYVVTRHDGTPALAFRVTEVQTVPFEGISHEHVQVEGPNARNVETWRRIHWEYWGGALRAQGREPSMQMPVIWHRFELLYPR